MIDDLWWYGDTMWYVYIIDIYIDIRLCVCANAVPICSNLLDPYGSNVRKYGQHSTTLA